MERTKDIKLTFLSAAVSCFASAWIRIKDSTDETWNKLYWFSQSYNYNLQEFSLHYHTSCFFIIIIR